MEWQSYYINYELRYSHFIDEKGNVIYTDKKIKTESDLVSLKEQIVEQYRKYQKSDVSWVDVLSISYLGTITTQEIEEDEYRIFEPFSLIKKERNE